MCGIFGQYKLNFGHQEKYHTGKALLPSPPTPGKDFPINYNIWTGMKATILVAGSPAKLRPFIFGLTPNWSSKQTYYFNARSEGGLNPNNSPKYKGEKGIFFMPSFREAVQKQRCLVPVDYFIEGTTKQRLQKPYLIQRKDKAPFWLAGIWDWWHHPVTKNTLFSFAIVTTAASPLSQKLPHHRSPLILEEPEAQLWLKKETPSEVLSQIMHPPKTTEYEAFRIGTEINRKINTSRILYPMPPSLFEIPNEKKIDGT